MNNDKLYELVMENTITIASITNVLKHKGVILDLELSQEIDRLSKNLLENMNKELIKS